MNQERVGIDNVEAYLSERLGPAELRAGVKDRVQRPRQPCGARR